MIDAPVGVLAVRRVRQLAAGTLVWDRNIDSWAVVAAARRCDGTGPAHPRQGQACAALALRPAVEVPRGEDRAVDEVHFALDAPVVVLVEVEDVVADAAG